MNFLQNLRRRRMFRLVGLYIVGAWVVIQVAEALFAAWGIPETAMRFVFVAAFLCFPVALVFGWVFDITSDGIVRTKKASSDTTVAMGLQKADYAILAALAAVGVVVMLGSAEKIQEEIQSGQSQSAAEERRANSVAVLPFKNLDVNVETGYFSDGVTEEILHRLSTRDELHVLASTSSFSFRDSALSPSQISESLGVRYLLDGSVRRNVNRVRVTARLLDDAGFQVWADTFDRDLTEIFAVQAEIANLVARKIVSEIVPFDQVASGRTTDNMEAYNAYLLGRYEADRRTYGWKERAEKAFRQAIELDASYAPPYAGLAILVVNSGLGPHWEEARKNALRAIELDPELAEAHAVLGLIQTAFDDPASGAESLELAIDIDPSYSSSYAWLAFALGRQDLDVEQREALYRGLEIDPLNPVLVANLAGLEESRGDFDAAEKLLLRLVALPEISGPATDILDVYHDWGRYTDELSTRKDIMRKLGSHSTEGLPYLARNYAALGMTTETEYWFDKALPGRADSDFLIADYYFVFKHIDDTSRLLEALETAEQRAQSYDDLRRANILAYGGLAWIHVGEPAKGTEWLETSLEMFRQSLWPEEPDSDIDVSLFVDEWFPELMIPMFQRIAFAYQQTDRMEDADNILQQLDEVLARFPATTPYQHEWLALQRGLSGDIDGALQSLSAALDQGWANYYDVSNDPAWSALNGDSRFIALLEEAKRRVDEQRTKVETIETSEDFHTEYARLIAQ